MCRMQVQEEQGPHLGRVLVFSVTGHGGLQAPVESQQQHNSAHAQKMVLLLLLLLIAGEIPHLCLRPLHTVHDVLKG